MYRVSRKCIENKRINNFRIQIILFIIRIKLYYYFSREKKQKITQNNITLIDFTFYITKIFEFRFKKKKEKRNLEKTKNFPSFFYCLLNRILIPRDTLYTTKQRIRHSIQQCQQYVEEETVERQRENERGTQLRGQSVGGTRGKERERAQRLPPIDFCALAVNSRVLLLYATPSPPSSYLASVIDYLIPIDRDPVHLITDHLPPPCPTLILDRFCTASINRREIDIPIPPPLSPSDCSVTPVFGLSN